MNMSSPNAVPQNKYKPIILMIVSVTLAGLAAWAAINYLEKREAAIKEEIVGNLSKIRVVVASRNVEPGEVISSANMSVREIPETYLPDAVVIPEDFDRINGLKLSQPVSSGKPLLRNSIKGLAGFSTFSELIPIGHRAITLEVDVISTNESLIVAGDYIDIAVVKDGNNSGGQSGFDVVLQKVLVMATGPITISEPPVNIVGYAEELYRYQSLTISVPEEDVQKVYAAEDGKFTLLVRNPDDKSLAAYDQSFSEGQFIEAMSGGTAEKGVLKTALVKPIATSSVKSDQDLAAARTVRRFGKYIPPVKEARSDEPESRAETQKVSQR